MRELKHNEVTDSFIKYITLITCISEKAEAEKDQKHRGVGDVLGAFASQKSNYNYGQRLS